MDKYNSEVLGTFEKGENDLRMDTGDANKEVDEAVLQHFESNVNSDDHPNVQDVDVMNVSFGSSAISDVNPNLENIDSQISTDNNQLNVASEIEHLHSAISNSVTNTNDEVDDVTNKMEWTTIADDTASTSNDNTNPVDNFLEGIRQENIEQTASLDNTENPNLIETSGPTSHTEENQIQEQVIPESVSASENLTNADAKLDENEPEKSVSNVVASNSSELNTATKGIAVKVTESMPNCSNNEEPESGEPKASEPQTNSEERTECKEPHIEESAKENSIHDEKSQKNTKNVEKINDVSNEQEQEAAKTSEVRKEVRFSENGDNLQGSTNTSKESTARDSENTEFVQVNSENDKEDDPQNKNAMEQDPISADISELPDNFEASDNREGADAELTIIPDTQREISQAEKEAACSIPPLKDLTEASASANEASGELPQTSGLQIVVYKYDKNDLQICNECKLQRKAKYYYSVENIIEYLCSDNCLNTFKNRQSDKVALNWEEGSLRVKNFVGVSKEPPSLSFIRKCALCKKITDDIEINLTWEIMDFCDELCLTKYQKEIGSRCSSCQTEVKSNSLGKYCVRFGNDIRQFCTSTCLEKYKKGLKVCSYCQQDMSTGPKGFLAPVGDKGQFKDFCSQVCMDKYDIMTNDKPPKVPPGTICSVCKGEKPIAIEFEHTGSLNHFCGEPCFVAFSFVNNISAGKCAMCKRHFPKNILEKYTMYYDNVQFSFCSNSCENIYIIAHRKIVPCNWCKVKKYNFDMIRRYSREGSVINTCSVNCLSLYRVSSRATSSRQTHCDYCRKFTHPMYYLTMSNATVKDFCSYNCVMTFQSQFPKQQFTMNEDDSYPVPTGAPRKNKRFMGLENATPITDASQLPVIASVQSLATNGNLGPPKGLVPPTLTPITTRTTRSKSAGTGTLNSSPQVINSFGDLPFQVQIKQHFIVRPAPMPEQKNAATMCYTRKMNKSITCKPEMVDQEVQTDEREASKILIPIPMPIFVPTPMHMFSVPTPTPVPFPVPVPIPVFIPTTRNSSAGIMKEMKKIMVKIPTDPYEAEILMMAEMVAEEKKEDITDSESDVDDTGGPEESYSPEPVDASNAFGDDMLQMALKMATELDEPAVDLEGALTANTITAPQGGEPHTQEEAVDDPQQSMHHHMLERSPSVRGRKRGMRQSRGGAKRGRRMQHQSDLSMMQPQVSQPPPQPEPQEKPDANMCLKYTFGVNAWKQWVTTKNAELEKTSQVMPEFLFKTEILQLTADELNYSLCLFVKEVRKPNGAEYAPDTIYYLCLGIQQYLFENGRIDNIFCDTYYEKFTDCLDEVAKKFSVLYNDSHYIVTRVEEEHLWESKQLGAHSPHVLLSTLMFFNTKHFNLTSVDEHMQLSFSHIMKHWKRNPNQPSASKVGGSRNVLLRFYPPQSAIQNNARKKKVYEQEQNEENPLRCPVKLYEFYISKCPESVKTRNDVFYLQPERSCVPDSPVWYSTMPLAREALEKMLHRVKMVKEINVALLTS